MRAMRASFGFGFGFDGSMTHGAVAAACHPKLASLCRRVVVSLCRRWAVSVSLARARWGGREPRAHNAPSSGRTGG